MGLTSTSTDGKISSPMHKPELQANQTVLDTQDESGSIIKTMARNLISTNCAIMHTLYQELMASTSCASR